MSAFADLKLLISGQWSSGCLRCGTPFYGYAHPEGYKSIYREWLNGDACARCHGCFHLMAFRGGVMRDLTPEEVSRTPEFFIERLKSIEQRSHAIGLWG